MYLQLSIIMLVLLYLFGNNHADDDRIVVILITITFESIFFSFSLANLLMTDALNIHNTIADIF